MSSPADQLLADQAWALYCRGAEIPGIAEALKRTPDEVAAWLAGRVPEGGDIQTERHLESLRTQLRKLYVEEQNAPASRKAQLLSQVNRIEGQVFAVERAQGRAAAPQPLRKAGDWRTLAPPVFREIQRIRKAAASSHGLQQCRFVDDVAFRLATSNRDDVTQHTAWLRDKAVRDCVGCPEMRKTHRCTYCARLLNDKIGSGRCQFHPDAPLEALPQPFKWCMTVSPREVSRGIKSLRNGLPDEFFAPAHYNSAVLADRNVERTEITEEGDRLFRVQKRRVQRAVEEEAASSHMAPELRAELRLLNEILTDQRENQIALGVVNGRMRPGSVTNVNTLNASLNQTNQIVDTGTGDVADRLSDAMRRNPNSIPEMMALLDRVSGIMAGAEPKEIVDVAGRQLSDQAIPGSDWKEKPPRRPGPATKPARGVDKVRRPGDATRTSAKASA